MIRIPLLFHFNQHISEDALVGSRTSYRGLLRVLRSHPTLPINIHISGTLVQALQWLDPEPLQLIWEGLRAGQFELLGSTYSQNVPYASNDWDNARQIELHQEVLHEAFGVTPVTFWNPQRTWRQSLLPLIAGAGYRFMLLEDHILAAARLAEPVVVTSQVDAHILTLIYDDQHLKNLFNFAVWFGRPSQLQSYLMLRSEQPNSDRHCLAYAEDAEAMGMWGWERGIVPNQTWHRLDQILSLMEALPDVEIIHLTNAPASAGNLSPIPDGSATWMDLSLQTPGRPHHEPGHDTWFSFNENSAKLAAFRTFYGELRERLQAVEKALKKQNGNRATAAKQLHRDALHNYLSHQYMFGCIGVGGEGFRGWEGARASWVLLQAAEWSVASREFVETIDINRDGKEEIALSDGSQLFVFTQAGGRLLYWIDLQNGRQYLGNHRAIAAGPYVSDADLPAREPLPYELWFPADYRPKAITHDARLTAEAAPTRLEHFLPEWIWEGERQSVELLTRETRDEGLSWPLPAQRRGFVDIIRINGESSDPGEWLEAEIVDGTPVFRRQLADSVTVEKAYAPDNQGVVATYLWKNDGENAVQIEWRVINELAPDYRRIVEKGREVVRFVRDEQRPGVRNTAAREEVLVIAEPLPGTVSFEEAILALEVHLTYELALPAGAESKFTIRLQRQATQAAGKGSARG